MGSPYFYGYLEFSLEKTTVKFLVLIYFDKESKD